MEVLLAYFPHCVSCLRGAIIEKNGKIGGKFPKGGGDFFQKKSQFQFGNFKNPGGDLNFSKMSELKVALRHHPKYQE